LTKRKKENKNKAAQGESVRLKYELSQNYPNPFNPETTIKFVIEKEEFVTLKLYNIIGQVVKTIISEELPGGEHQVKIDAQGLNSGVYFYTITAGDFSQTKRMTLVK